MLKQLIFNKAETCGKCINAIHRYGYYNLKLNTKGYWKWHTHEPYDQVRIEPMNICGACERNLRDYDSVDLELKRFDGKVHYQVKDGARTKKEKEMVTKAATTTGKAGDWYWHVHHQVLVEQLTQPLDARIADIKAGKNAKETRLHFMRPVQNPPANAMGDAVEIKQAQTVYNAVKAAYNNGNVTISVLNRASARLDTAKSKASTVTKAQWEALHKKECFHYCPWNGTTLLPIVAVGKQ